MFAGYHRKLRRRPILHARLHQASGRWRQQWSPQLAVPAGAARHPRRGGAATIQTGVAGDTGWRRGSETSSAPSLPACGATCLATWGFAAPGPPQGAQRADPMACRECQTTAPGVSEPVSLGVAHGQTTTRVLVLTSSQRALVCRPYCSAAGKRIFDRGPAYGAQGAECSWSAAIPGRRQACGRSSPAAGDARRYYLSPDRITATARPCRWSAPPWHDQVGAAAAGMDASRDD